MNKLIKFIANIFAELICIVAKGNVACATGWIGYQPELPKILSEEERDVQL